MAQPALLSNDLQLTILSFPKVINEVSLVIGSPILIPSFSTISFVLTQYQFLNLQLLVICLSLLGDYMGWLNSNYAYIIPFS